jgi:subtilisin family serine protease
MSSDSRRRPERPQRSSRLSSQLEQLESRRLMSGDPASLRAAGFEPIDWNGRETFVRPGEWIVKIDGLEGLRGKQLKGANALLAGTGISARKQLGADGVLLVESAPAATVDHLRKALQRVPGFDYIEPNFAFAVEQTPNDADFSRLWGLHNANDADIDAPEAWDLSTGGGSTVVGVIDSGVDYNHPDLKANMWVNPFEIAGDGIDNEGNGYVDDIHGANFITGSGNPMDDQGHGTHVAGTIGGVGNNGAGMTGVNWNAQVMGLKFLAADGYGTGADAIEALYYTLDMKRRGVNVTVTNNSYGGEPFSRAFYDALKASGDAGQLFIAASGNGDWLGRAINNDVTPHFPSSYGHDGRTFDDPATSTVESLPSLDNVIATA